MSHHDPSESIKVAHARHLQTMPFGDRQDFEDADRGFLGTLEDPAIRNEAGDVVWDNSAYDFLDGEAPESVHPSLWRQAQLVAKHGLYEVVEGIYQVRGFDLSVMSIIEGDEGVIVVDPFIGKENSAAGIGLYRDHRGDRPVKAVIFTHSHIDHFGGVFGLVSQVQVDNGEVEIIAPEGLVEHAVAENVYAGTAMARRAGYMYGALLHKGPQGQVGAGLGQSTSVGAAGLIVPTIDVAKTGESHTIDGVEMEFQMAPGTEAPAEMHFFLPRYNALCMAENVTHTLHNLLTLRGALVRDPNVWAKYLTEAIGTFGDRTDVLFSSHHWPTWGRERVFHYIGIQRDLYKYLHDQTLRMLNQGMTGAEIAEEITLPPAIENVWGTHGYYGSVSHNVKAIYQRYMGWFDGNPARLWPHPPKAQAERYVKALGGMERVVELAQEAYDEGDFRWAATLLDNAIFTEADHAATRELYAATLEQLGYGSENGTWRNFFLSGAQELREGNFGTPTTTAAPEIVAQLSPEQIWDAMAIAVDGPKAWDLDLALDVTLTDLGRSFRVTLRNGVLVGHESEPREGAAARLSLTKMRLIALTAGDTESPGIEIDGDGDVLDQLLSVMQPGDPRFEIVVP
ncbi:alkyl/aryl-sulfatase [Demequina flava]|uniref:alkyl/aryl-sulfatase n=1 Tax=Demequina flava TaxID=1095025 RepID=UPI0007805FA4|nr:alkyl sulfatase dimerization domain-containing protein [Demequina flava]